MEGKTNGMSITVKKVFSILIILLVFMSSIVGSALADDFSVRNNIRFGDTKEEVKAKESLPISNEAEKYFIVEGTVASVDNSTVLYSFNDGKLCNVKIDFGVHIGKSEQAISAYKTVFDALSSKYGEPYSVDGNEFYIVYGFAVSQYLSAVDGLSSLGINMKNALQNKSEWILRLDDINVKIDLVRFAVNGGSSSDVVLSYKAFTDEEEQNAIESENAKNANIQNDL